MKLRVEAMKTEKIQLMRMLSRLAAQSVEATFVKARGKDIPPHQCLEATT